MSVLPRCLPEAVAPQAEPFVGMGVTFGNEYGWCAATIVRVSEDRATICFQMDRPIRKKGEDKAGVPAFLFVPDPKGDILDARWGDGVYRLISRWKTGSAEAAPVELGARRWFAVPRSWEEEMKKTVAQATHARRTRRPRILLVEDTPERVAFFRERLRPAYVSLARNYAAAVRALRRGRYHTVWLDHDLADPRHNGQDVAAFIRELPRSQRPRNVVVHSVNAAGALGCEQILRGAGVAVDRDPFPPVRLEGTERPLSGSRCRRRRGS